MLRSIKKECLIVLCLILVAPLAWGRLGDGIRINKWEIDAFLETGLGYDNNIFLQERNEIEDSFLRLNTQIDTRRLTSPENAFFFSYNGEFFFYEDLTDENTQTHDMVAGYDYRANTVYGTIKYDYMDTNQLDGVLFTNRFDRQVLIPSLLAGIEFNRIALEATLLRRSKRYDSGELRDREFDEDMLKATLVYRYSDKTDFLFEYMNSEVDYDIPGLLDGGYNQFRTGIKGRITPKITGQILVGIQDREYDRNPLEYNDWVAAMDLQMRFTETLKLNLGYDLSTEESIVEETIFYKFKRFRADFIMESPRRITLQTGGFIEKDDFASLTGLDRDDDVYNFYIQGGYRFNEGLKAILGFDILNRDSSIDIRDYDRQRIYLSATVTM